MRQAVIFFLIISAFCNKSFSQSVSIGTPTPHSTALLDLTSTNKGLLVPRVDDFTSVIIGPAKGLLIYDSARAQFFYFNGVDWKQLTTPDDLPWYYSGSVIYPYSNAARVGIGTSNPQAKLQVNHRATAALPTVTLFDSTAGTGSSILFSKQGVTGNFQASADITGNTAANNNFRIQHAGASVFALTGDGRLGLGATTPASSALLELNSTNKGLLFSRLADTSAVASPSKGVMIYNNADNKFWFYNGSRWQQTNSNNGGLDSIWYKSNDSTVFTSYEYVAVNTDTKLSAPLANMQVNGSFLVHGEYNYSEATPSAGQTYTMNNTSFQNITTADSVFRIFDPGGVADYSNNMQGNLSQSLPANCIGAVLTFNPADFDIAAGDTLWIGNSYDYPNIRTSYLFRFTNTNSAPEEFSMPRGGGPLYIIFRSNGDGNNGSGFDLKVKNLFRKTNWINNTIPAGASMYFNPNTSSLMAGFGNYADNTSAAFGLGSIADGNMSFAAGVSTSTGQNAVALGNSKAEGVASFAAGQSIATGNYSTATGQSHAIGANSVSLGNGNAFGSRSITLGGGVNVNAFGNNSIAIGDNVDALAPNSVVIGDEATVSGTNAFSIGRGTVARSFSSIALGMYNDSIITSTTASSVATDPLLVLGNGSSDGVRRNAMVVLKNGNTGLGVDNPTAKLEVEGSVRLGAAGTTISNFIYQSVQWVAFNLPANSSTLKTFTVNGVNGVTNGVVSISPNNALQDGVVIAYARVSANNTIEVKVLNTTGTAFSGGSPFFRVLVVQ